MKRISRALVVFLGAASSSALSTVAFAQEPPAAAPPPAVAPPPPAAPTPPPAPATPPPAATPAATPTPTEPTSPPPPPPVTPVVAPSAEASKAAAAKKQEEDPGPWPLFALGIEGVFGWAKGNDVPVSPYPYTLSSQEKSVQSYLLSASARTSKGFAISARFPIVHAAFAAGLDGETATTVGNLEFAPKYILELQKNLEMFFEMGLALPTAAGDRFSPDQKAVRQEFANLAADRSRGLEDTELFAAHRLGFVPRVSAVYDANNLELSAYTKLDLLQRINGTFTPDNVYKNPTLTNWVTGIRAYYGIVDKMFSIGLKLWGYGNLAQDIATPAGGTDPKHTQFVFEPGLKSELGPARIGVSYLLPLGGPLGDQSYKSFRVTLGAAFLDVVSHSPR